MSLRILIFISVVVSLFLWSFRSPAVSTLSTGIALATLWACLIPTFVYIRSKDRAPMPFMALTGVYYAVFFCNICFLFPDSASTPQIWRSGQWVEFGRNDPLPRWRRYHDRKLFFHRERTWQEASSPPISAALFGSTAPHIIVAPDRELPGVARNTTL